jgi:two-component system sensor histidine kinase UhpB
MATALFRIVQEAVSNVIRHAGAKSVTIDLQASDARLQLQIRDDGRGFDPELAFRDAVELHRLGLLGIRERVERLGGQVEVDSAPGKGTIVQASIPVRGIGEQDPHSVG